MRLNAFLPIAVCLASIPAGSAAVVTTLDGDSLKVEAVAFVANAVQVPGRTPIALDDVDAIELERADGAEARLNSTGVLLADGGWLPARTVAAGKDDHLAVDLGGGKDGKNLVELPLLAVTGWGRQDLPVRERDLVLVNGQQAGGRVQGIAGGKLMFAAEGSDQAVALDFDKIGAVRLKPGPQRAQRGATLLAALDQQRQPVRLLAGPRVALAAAPAVELGGWDAPFLAGARLRVEGPRRHWLSDLKPSTVEEKGMFGVTWPWKRDSDLDGEPLRLGGVRYVRGLTVHSQARLTWKLAGAYRRLHTLVGISDTVAPEGDLAVALVADGKTLWSRDRVRGGEAPVAVDLDLTGAQVLELKVDYGQRYDIGDHCVLADAFLVKAK